MPCSTIFPFFKTIISSALSTVDSLWAITIVDLFAFSFSIASWTNFSDSESKAEVASSKSKMEHFFKKARAIAILCLCPPDKSIPSFPTKVSYPSGNFEMNSSACACLEASYTSSSEASGFAYLILLNTVSSNKIVVCPTADIFSLRFDSLISLIE